SVVHRMNRTHCIVAMVSRWPAIQDIAKTIQEQLGWPFPNTNRAIALHVAVTTHRTEACARFSDLATQQHQVDDLLDVRDGIAVLRESHGPAEDRPLRRNKDFGGLFN